MSSTVASPPRGASAANSLDTLVHAAIERGPVPASTASSTAYQPYRPSTATSYQPAGVTSVEGLAPIHVPGIPTKDPT